MSRNSTDIPAKFHSYDKLNKWETCPAKLWLSTSPHKKNLQVDHFKDKHNHPPTIVGKDGPVKHRQLLLEDVIKLYKKFQAQKSGPVKKSTESRRKSDYELQRSGHKSTDKYVSMQPVIVLRRVNDPKDIEFIKFTSFLESLRPKVDVEKSAYIAVNTLMNAKTKS
ncbi:hypothetical protein KQX54_012995 [Cotesia glomerata]|uniref:Uncharacterized protein n=1 Tax=Cotesia glomerata TaxID=32391 RepID=A0AAV7IH85_COTGL|nr:hypothetical protein KQX54_012995 [Cotesia glomerata]